MEMNEDFSLRPDEIALIRPFLHDCLRRVISKDRPDQIDEDEFWQPVQVEFDGGAFQVYNDLVVANYFDGKEDCGRMSVLPPEKIPEPAYVMEINQPVKNILLATNRIRFSEPGGWHFMDYLKVRYHEGVPWTVLTGEFFDRYDPECDDVCPDFQQTIVPINHL